MEQSPYEHIVEFGCSTGQFAKELVNSTKSTDIKSNLDNVTTAENEFNYLGFDIDYIAIQKAKRKLSKYKNVKLKQADIVNSYIPEVTCSNVLLLIEFIEHLTTEERNTLAKLLNEAYQPYNIVITTPNIEYNINYGLAEGQYRHRDHLIEFNNDELNEYLALFTNYTWTLHNIPSYDDIQPSFVVCMQLKDTAKINDDFVNEFRAKQIEHAYEKGAMQSPFMLPNFSYTVNSKQIKIGMESKAFKANRDKVFYLGSSMAPSDIKQMYGAFETLQNEGIFAMPGIEHPMYAIDYFNSKGISTNDLVAEIKYMGSRAYILAFKNEQIAKMFNMPLITINSRSGWEFFDEEDDNFKHEIYNVIRDSFLSDNDFIALEAEITQWLYKSKGLIYKEFALPVLLQLNGAIAAFNETFSTTDNSRFLNAIVLCTDFLSTLEHFSKVEPIHVHVFDMLAKGTIGKYDRPVVQYGRHLDRLTVNEWLNERLISNDIVSIAKQVKGADIMSLWTSLDDSYEGIVIKPRKYEFKNGSAIIPYMKCRRDSYLQLIYSPYFNEESLQRRIFYRNVAKKRRLSLFQDELGFYILNAFFKHETQLLHKYIATFYATDGVGDFGGQDMTL